DPGWPAVPGLVLAAQARVGGEWRHLPATWATVTGDGQRRRVQATIPATGVRSGTTVDVSAEAWLAPEPGRTRYRTPALAIPAGGILEVGAGILPAAASQGPVRFSIAACDGDECADLFTTDVDEGRNASAGWHDLRVPLAAVAGTRRALRFE